MRGGVKLRTGFGIWRRLMGRNELGGRRVGMPCFWLVCCSDWRGWEGITDEKSGLVNILQVCCFCDV